MTAKDKQQPQKASISESKGLNRQPRSAPQNQAALDPLQGLQRNLGNSYLQAIASRTTNSDGQHSQSGVSPNSSDVPSIVHEVLNSPGQPLDPTTRAFMESRFNHDFSRVQVHTDAKAAESALAVRAKAYAVKHNIVFGEGQYAPVTQEGKQRLAHELAHVVQQNQSFGRSASTEVAEQEAGKVAEQVASGQLASVSYTVATGSLQKDALTPEELSELAVCEYQMANARSEEEEQKATERFNALQEKLKRVAAPSAAPPSPKPSQQSSKPSLPVPEPVEFTSDTNENLQGARGAGSGPNAPESLPPAETITAPQISPEDEELNALAENFSKAGISAKDSRLLQKEFQSRSRNEIIKKYKLSNEKYDLLMKYFNRFLDIEGAFPTLSNQPDPLVMTEDGMILRESEVNNYHLRRRLQKRPSLGDIPALVATLVTHDQRIIGTAEAIGNLIESGLPQRTTLPNPSTRPSISPPPSHVAKASPPTAQAPSLSNRLPTNFGALPANDNAIPPSPRLVLHQGERSAGQPRTPGQGQLKSIPGGRVNERGSTPPGTEPQTQARPAALENSEVVGERFKGTGTEGIPVLVPEGSKKDSPSTKKGTNPKGVSGTKLPKVTPLPKAPPTPSTTGTTSAPASKPTSFGTVGVAHSTTDRSSGKGVETKSELTPGGKLWEPPKHWNGPRNHGKWEGARGDSNWIDDRPEVIRVVGRDPKSGEVNSIPFKKGLVDFSRWSQGELSVEGLTGDHAHDMPIIREAIAIQKNLLGSDGKPSRTAAIQWLNNADDGFGGKGLRPHHAGGDIIQLIPKNLHKVQHTDITHD